MKPAAPQAPAVQPGWCPGCTPDECPGCGPAAQSAPQAPLTPLQIAEACGLRTDIAPAQAYIDIARAIEAAHGIRAAGVKEPGHE